MAARLRGSKTAVLPKKHGGWKNMIHPMLVSLLAHSQRA
jgi:hypothetical protein